MFTEQEGLFRFLGNNVAISCVVRWDIKSEQYIAKSEHGHSGCSWHSKEAAALNCFKMWMCGEGGSYEASPDPQENRDPGQESMGW